jgi:hypothetical protein
LRWLRASVLQKRLDVVLHMCYIISNIIYEEITMSETNYMTPFLINGLSAEMLAEALREYGCRAQIDDSNEQGPRIISGIHGLWFLVDPIGASIDDKFSRWQFVVRFNIGHPCSLETANEFNRTYQFGRFFVDPDGDPNLDWICDFGGGVSPTYLPQIFKLWEAAIACFLDHLRDSAP